MNKFKIGEVVYYIPYKGCNPSYWEKGIVKSTHPTDPNIVFVVYSCGGNWEHYYDYTGVSTNINQLTTI